MKLCTNPRWLLAAILSLTACTSAPRPLEESPADAAVARLDAAASPDDAASEPADTGVAAEVDAGQPDAGPPDSGFVDTGSTESDGGSLGQDGGMSADAQEACLCDLTTVCDQNCACDPECQDAGRVTPSPRSGGCSCEGTSPTELAGLSAAALALALIRRRRR